MTALWFSLPMLAATLGLWWRAWRDEVRDA